MWNDITTIIILIIVTIRIILIMITTIKILMIMRNDEGKCEVPGLAFRPTQCSLGGTIW